MGSYENAVMLGKSNIYRLEGSGVFSTSYFNHLMKLMVKQIIMTNGRKRNHRKEENKMFLKYMKNGGKLSGPAK